MMGDILFKVLVTVSVLTDALNFRNMKLIVPFLKENVKRNDVTTWLQVRSGKPGEQHVWYFHGVLRNPLTGGEVVCTFYVTI